MVSEIAEYAGCDASVVWYAIRNECHDDLNEDQDYIDGRIGDVVDLGTRDESERWDIKMEDTEAEDNDWKLDNSASRSGESTPFFDCADLEDDGKLTNFRFTWDAEPEDSLVDPIAGTSDLSADQQDYHIRRVSSALSSLTPLTESATESDNRGSEENLPRFDSGETVHRHIVPAATHRCRSDFPSTQEASNPRDMLFGRLSSSSLTLNGTSPQTKACAVKMFLDDLERPCGHLIPYFRDMELDSKENLDHLCRMDEKERAGISRANSGAKKTIPSSIPAKATPGRARRHVEPSLTRPQRAIARQLYREQTHTNKEIADYLKCDTRDIYTAINNETHDNLNEDEHYYNEARDFIDVDLYYDASDSLQAEESELMEVDQKLVVDLNDISDFEMEENDSYDGVPQVPEQQPHTSQSSRLLRAQRTKLSPRVQDNPIPPVPSYKSSPRRPGKQPAQTASQRTSRHDYSNSGAQHAAVIPSTSSTLSSDPVETFLLGLKRPCGQLLGKFNEYGIATSADLDALCQMKEYWNEVEHYFVAQGVTPFEWLVVQEGLRARASRLPG
ncbi:hypothetical protein EIP86_003594 [Pleurotus ostreatoroseus]|nr:hypothetical protein EIP86_003594 [Pleurotus ostreatoroseus]